MATGQETLSATQGLTLGQFLRELDGFRKRIPLDELKRRLEALRIGIEDVKEWVSFGRDGYQRNLMHAGPVYHALVLCWRAGQRSPIHDHRGSSCGVRVIKGKAVETRFAFSPDGLVYATGSTELGQGSICGSEDSDTHQMSNLQAPGNDLVTLHIYSPPLLTMGKYSLTEPVVAEFVDPIVGFAEGDGI